MFHPSEPECFGQNPPVKLEAGRGSLLLIPFPADERAGVARLSRRPWKRRKRRQLASLLLPTDHPSGQEAERSEEKTQMPSTVGPTPPHRVRLMVPSKDRKTWNGAGEEHGSAMCLPGLNKKGDVAHCSPASRR